MKTCKQCSKVITGKKKFCNDACRKAYSRKSDTKSDKTQVGQPQAGQIAKSDTQVGQAGVVTEPRACIEHYRAYPERYAKRVNPENLNWGEPMSKGKLDKAGLAANRVAIPGDWDYISKPKDTTSPTLTARPAVVKAAITQPTGQPNTDTKAMTGQQLNRAIQGYSGLQWVSSPEYAELIKRLNTLTLKELKEIGIIAPQWRAARG